MLATGFTAACAILNLIGTRSAYQIYRRAALRAIPFQTINELKTLKPETKYAYPIPSQDQSEHRKLSSFGINPKNTDVVHLNLSYEEEEIRTMLVPMPGNPSICIPHNYWVTCQINVKSLFLPKLFNYGVYSCQFDPDAAIPLTHSKLIELQDTLQLDLTQYPPDETYTLRHKIFRPGDKIYFYYQDNYIRVMADSESKVNKNMYPVFVPSGYLIFLVLFDIVIFFTYEDIIKFLWHFD